MGHEDGDEAREVELSMVTGEWWLKKWWDNNNNSSTGEELGFGGNNAAARWDGPGWVMDSGVHTSSSQLASYNCPPSTSPKP